MSIKLCINNSLQIDALGQILDFKCFRQCIGTGLHHPRAEAPGFTSRALNFQLMTGNWSIQHIALLYLFWPFLMVLCGRHTKAGGEDSIAKENVKIH